MGAPDYATMVCAVIVLWTIVIFLVGLAVGMQGQSNLPTKQDVERLRKALEDLEKTAKLR